MTEKCCCSIQELVEKRVGEYTTGDKKRIEDIKELVELCSKDGVWISILNQCISGLQYLHSLNMCHRDIKPQNILLTRKGIVKLSDMGLTKKLEASSQSFQTNVTLKTDYRELGMAASRSHYEPKAHTLY